MTEFPKTLPSRILQVVKPELEDSEKVQFIGNIVQTRYVGLKSLTDPVFKTIFVSVALLILWHIFFDVSLQRLPMSLSLLLVSLMFSVPASIILSRALGPFSGLQDEYIVITNRRLFKVFKSEGTETIETFPRDAVKRVMANKGRAEIEIADSKVLICCQIPQ